MEKNEDEARKEFHCWRSNRNWFWKRPGKEILVGPFRSKEDAEASIEETIEGERDAEE